MMADNYSLMRDQIFQRFGELRSAVDGYSMSQVDSWKRIPFLALQATTPDNIKPTYRLAYEEGLWQIESPFLVEELFADLDSGRLVNRKLVNTSDYSRVLAFAQEYPKFDAGRIADSLLAEAAQVNLNLGADAETWRGDLIARLGIKTIYSRPSLV
jgi:hypothetical protein